MKTSLKTSRNRELVIDFDLYTDGDMAFKQELISLMVNNLKELEASLVHCLEQHTVDIFRKTAHKVKPTISMLSDHALIEAIAALEVPDAGTIDPQKANRVQVLCNDIIKSLENEVEKDNTALNDSKPAHAA